MNDDLTTELTRQLHAEADAWHGAPLTLERVQGTARTIRRRRRAAAGGVLAAAVLAVAIPVGITFGDGPDTSPPPTTPSPTRVVETDDPATRSPLGVPFLEGRTLTLPDGTSSQLPQSYQGGVVLGDTVLGLHIDDNGLLFLDVLGADLGVDETVPLDTRMAQNAEGTALAYVTGGEMVVRSESGQTSLGPVVEGISPVRLVGGPDCTDSATPCEVYVEDEFLGPPRVLTASGSRLVPGDPLGLTDVREDGSIAMVTEVRDADLGVCGRVFDPATRTTVFETCEVTLERFSPDGHHLSADAAYQDGLRGYVAILDAQTGQRVAEVRGDGSFFTEVTWEDPTHLLAVSFTDGEGWSVVRLGVDGSVETAYGPVAGSPDAYPLHLLG